MGQLLKASEVGHYGLVPITILQLRGGCGGHRQARIAGLIEPIWRAWSCQLKRKMTYLFFGYHISYHNLTRGTM